MSEPTLIPLSKIIVPSVRVRSLWTEEDEEELLEDIKRNGILNPLLGFEEDNGKIILIDGERRLSIAEKLGMKAVPFRILGKGDELGAIVLSFSTSKKRPPDPVSMAWSIKKLMDRYGLTQEQVADRLNMTQPTVNHYLKLLDLSDSVIQKYVSTLKRDRLGLRHAMAIADIEDAEIQMKLADMVVRSNLTAERTEEITASIRVLYKEKGDWKLSYREVMSKYSKYVPKICFLCQEVEQPDVKGKERLVSERIHPICRDKIRALFEKYSP